MLKRIIYIENPSALFLKNNQLIIQMKDSANTGSIPFEDIGIVLLDNPGITITQSCFRKFAENSIVVIICDESHLPASLTIPFSGNTLFQERFENQIKASPALNNGLWKQTIKMKIQNQARVLAELNLPDEPLLYLAKQVKSGDSGNIEARAARVYWKILFSDIKDFKRDREGDAPNNLLNYGYIILRSMLARAIVSAGLHPSIGIHHHNRYNPFCLADDIMEPYRPFIDIVVRSIIDREGVPFILTKEIKQQLICTMYHDGLIAGNRKSLFLAAHSTAASLAQVYIGENKNVEYPILWKENVDPNPVEN